MAIKGYYDNPDEATSVNGGDYLGIQQGTTLADMKKVKKQTLFKPTDDAIVELEGRATDLENSDVTLNGKIDGLAGTGRTTETVKQNADDIATKESIANVNTLKGTGWTNENLVDHESRLDTLEGADTVSGSVAKTIKDAVEPIIEDVSDHEMRITSLEAYNPINSWQNIQEILRQGRIKQYLSVGDQFLAEYNSAPTIFNVIGIDHPGLVPTDPRFTHTLALQPQDCLMNAQFSAPQAMYNAVTALPAGTYIFTTNGVQYQVTTTVEIPAGGILYIATRDEYVPLTLTSYNADRVTTIETGLVVTTATGSDTLTPINDHARCRYGSNNPVDNAMRQFLNSNEAVFNWEPQGLYDMPSSYSGTGGFLYQLDPELVAVIGEVENKVALSTYDGGGQVTVQDKAFLLSRVEVGLGSEGVTTGESVYEFYDGVTDAERIKLLSGSPRYWWLRSPGVGSTYITRLVNPSGSLYGTTASNALGLSPACVIW